MRKLHRKRKRYTPLQALNSPVSGVPLVDNAANLEHFWNKSSGVNNADGTATLADLRAGYTYIFDDSEKTNDFDTHFIYDGDLIGFNVQSGAQLGTAQGTLTQFALNEDFLFVVSGRAANALPGDDLRFRFGGGEVQTENWIRLRTQKTIPLGDTIYDANGSFISNAARQVAVMDVDLILVCAYDSTNDELRTQTYSAAGVLVDDVTTSTVGMAAIECSSLVGDASPLAAGGWWYGVGVWKFTASTLPSDWSIAALNMGRAWANGNYTFWPEWGKE